MKYLCGLGHRCHHHCGVRMCNGNLVVDNIFNECAAKFFRQCSSKCFVDTAQHILVTVGVVQPDAFCLPAASSFIWGKASGSSVEHNCRHVHGCIPFFTVVLSPEKI